MILTEPKEEYPLGLHLEILEDREKKWKIEDASSPKLTEYFFQSSKETPNFGFIDYAYWVRFKLINKSHKEDWLLEISYPLLDQIEVYIPATYNNGKTRQNYIIKTAGENYPFYKRELKHQNFVFHLRILAGKEITYYIRFESTGSVQLPLTLLSPAAFSAKDHEQRIVLGLYYGIILALLLYNIFLFFSLRDKNYLYYVLYLASYGLLQLLLNGLASEYIWPDLPWWSNRSMPFLISVVLLWVSRFSSNFLVCHIYAPKTDKFFSALIFISIAGMLWSLFGNYYIALLISIGTMTLWIPAAISAGVISWRKGYRPARYFIIAWTTFLSGAFIYILRASGFIPNTFITTNSMQIGSALEVILLSLALADRIDIMKKEKEDAQALAIENLHKADKLKDEFLANTSHELKTPLNGIIGIAETMMDNANISQDQRLRLSLILSSGKRLLNMVNEILDISKLKHHDIILQQKPVDMRQVAELIVILSRPLLSGKPIILDNAIGEDLPPVLGDEDRIQQIMHNLIGNAIKFTESGTVKISAAVSSNGKTRDFIEIRISDTGIGIPEEKLESIFKSFEQADASISRLYGGTGLGLSITKQLIELHGGTIRVNSKPGAGSEFIFTIPVCTEREAEIRDADKDKIGTLKQDEAEEAIEITLPHADIQQGDRRILAVDDDPVNLQVVADQLSQDGYAVSMVSGGAEALNAIEKDNFDLVLLDVMMPRMSGYEVCRKIRQRYSLSELPVIMLTARDRVPDMIEGLESGANDYIAKPVSRGELLRRVKTHIENASYYKELKQLNEHLDSLMKDFSMLTAKIHNSLKNKLESLQNFLSHSIRVYDDREKLMENLRIAKNLVSHCSTESKNILFVTTHKECTITKFLDELELQAELAFSGSQIKHTINKNDLPLEKILSLEIILNLLEIYSEILNNIVKHSEASNVDITVQYADEHLSIIVSDNGIGFDYKVQRVKKGSYGLNILEDLAQEIGALLEIQSISGHGSVIKISMIV
ncbi:MAG: 7TM diverse intracellular signaling domain-containing protein [Spirochaetota bacterium]